MGEISVLPDILASQVAAGEVVERPASVVKELVENSLDAGASQIEVCVDRGGVALLRVSDNGKGMDRDDAQLCLGRHATSKLKDSEGLANILTMGFRGEALPSIASVSRFSLQTRQHNALAGTEVTIEGGTITEVKDWGGAPGTVMEVRSLFFNVPARRKFLRTETTEFSHIEQTLRVQALAHPDVGFTLLHNGRHIFHLPPRGGLLARIEALAGHDIAGGLLEVPRRSQGRLAVSGFMSRPGRVRSDRAFTLFFLNRRPIESPVLSNALRQAYGDHLARGQHPPCFLHLELPPAEVDVNVHPAKKEVRFRDGLGIQAALATLLGETLREALQPKSTPALPANTQPVTRQPEAPPPLILKAAEVVLRPTATQLDLGVKEYLASPPSRIECPTDSLNKSTQQTTAQAAKAHLDSPPSTRSPVGNSSPPPPSPSVPSVPVTPKFRLLGQLDGGAYAVLESAEGLVLMERRGAQERVLYEALKRQLLGEMATAQALLMPLTIPLSPRDFATAREHLEPLRQLGFGVEEFGHNTVKIDALPAVMPSNDPAQLFQDLLGDLRRAGETAARSRLDLDTLAATISARLPAFSQEPTPAETESLLQRLLSCEMPYCDPHGRPTLVQMSFQELARKFGRKG